MKIKTYEPVTLRGAARLESLKEVRAVCDAVMLDGGAESIRKERAHRLIIRIDTVLMEHRIYQRGRYVTGTFGAARWAHI